MKEDQSYERVFEERWKYIHDELQSIYEGHQVLTTNEYMMMYKTVYELATMSSGEDELEIAAYTMVGLHEHLRNYLIEYIKKVRHEIENYRGVKLLENYCRIWKKFKFDSEVVNGVFSYLNTHWMEEGLDYETRRRITYNLAITCWQNELFDHLAGLLKDALLTQNRKNAMTPLVNEILDSYLEMRSVHTNGVEENYPETYREFFEKFIENTHLSPRG